MSHNARRTSRSRTSTSAQRGTGTFVSKISGGSKSSFPTGRVIKGAPRKQIRGEAAFIQQTGRNLQGELINPSAGGSSPVSLNRSVETPKSPIPAGPTSTSILSRENTARFAKAPEAPAPTTPAKKPTGLSFGTSELALAAIAVGGLILLNRK